MDGVMLTKTIARIQRILLHYMKIKTNSYSYFGFQLVKKIIRPTTVLEPRTPDLSG